jgi:IS605 family transposase
VTYFNGKDGVLVKNQTYRAFMTSLTHILDLNGELLDSAPVLDQLVSEIRSISAYATFVARNDTVLGTELARATAVQAATAGRRAGVTMPDFLITGRSGRSRKEWLVRYNAVTAYRSWQERINAANRESGKYVSQGWRRTVDASAPSYGEDFINLGSVDRQYAVIENNPFDDGEIVLKMVVQGAWYRLIFNFDNARFREGKVTLPLVKVENDHPIFIFSVVTDNPVVQFSGDYTVGVDVGINNYATVVVRNTATEQVVYKYTLSQRVHSLWNSVRASENQVRSLRKKAASLLYDRQARMCALDEAQLHREAAARKKRELAILAAQEIAYLSHFYGNAVVAVEDLSWISNTMQNGRWNRGDFMQWLTHYVTQNGGWVVSVNAAKTSQLCHVCGEKVAHPEHKLSVCSEHGTMGRDVNAAANIAARAVSRVEKARKTRAKNRKLQEQAPRKTPVARDSLKYPSRDRTKSAPTPKRKKKGVKTLMSPARVQASCLDASVLADCGAHGATETRKAALKQGNVAYKCRLCSLI